MKADIEGPCGEVTRAEAVRYVVTERAILRKERETRRMGADSVAKDEEIQQLRLELEHEQVRLQE
jgi:acyl CoA:acetate/3-ketoacid CoA transferase beta subunit